MMNLGSEMFEGHHRDKCSVDDFITYMPAGSGSSLCQETSGPKDENNRLRVFSYPGTLKFSASAGSLVKKFTRYLQSLNHSFGGSSLLLQLWTPIRCSSGGVMLTVSEHPFAIQELCKGLFRYRYSCIQQDINVEAALVGPIGKVFTQGYHAYCDSTSSFLSNCAFAEPCGIGNDWGRLALPLFEKGELQQCAGVLEVFSYHYSNYGFWNVAVSLKSSGIQYRRSDFLECFEARCSVTKSTIEESLLHDVRRELESPLIQIWHPCMCDATNEFLCTRASKDYSITKYRLECDYKFFSHGSGFIQNPLVERAYSENKACYIRDTSLSISDYPLVQFTLSDCPYACCVVQLKSIHDKLHPLVLEVFLPRLQNCDQGNLLAQLNSLLSTVAREFSKRNAAFGLQENEELFVSNCHSDDDNVIFFEIHRNNKRMATDATIGHGIEDSGQNCGIHDTFVNRVVTSSRESLRSCDDVITMDGILIREEDKDTGEDVQMIEEMRQFLGFNQEKQQFPPTTLQANDHSKSMPEDTAQTSREVFPNAEAEISVDAVPSGEEVEVAAETLDGELVQSHEMLGSSIQVTAENSKEMFTVDQDKLTLDMINEYCGRAKLADVAKELKDNVESLKKTCTVGEDEITLDMINQYRGRAKLADAATKLNVSKSTLKRRCRKFGIRRWPHHKRNEVHNIQSNPGLPKTNLFEVGGRVIQDSEIMECSNNDKAPDASSIPASAKGKSIAAENHEIDQGYRLIVKASCRDDVAKFPFYSNSGIEQLRGELVKRFELEGGRFKIKYKDEDDDGEWIILSCNDDLLFHIKTIRASGMSTMRLSVFPVTL